MASYAALIRLKNFQIRQHRRTITQIQKMIAGIELLVAHLDREIRAEQDRTRMHDPAHFAYPTYATATTQRRDNLKHSADKLKIQAETAERALSEAIEELEAVEPLDASGRITAQPRAHYVAP